MHRGDLDDDEAGASRGPRPVVGDERVVDTGPVHDAGLVTSAHDPVAQAHAANREGAEEVGKVHGGSAHGIRLGV